MRAELRPPKSTHLISTGLPRPGHLGGKTCILGLDFQAAVLLPCHLSPQCQLRLGIWKALIPALREDIR